VITNPSGAARPELLTFLDSWRRSITMSDPFSINGGSVVALVGKDCVGIACDLRLGQQALTVSTDFPKIFPMGDKVFLGLAGLATDVQTLYGRPRILI
jgi:20S proteasome alpha/beta subunit